MDVVAWQCLLQPAWRRDDAVQAARVQAQQAGYLRSTPQQRVYDSGGLITIVPVNPGVVYVPITIRGGSTADGFALRGLLCSASAHRTRARGGTRIRRRWHFHWAVCSLPAGVFIAGRPTGTVVSPEYNHATYFSRSGTVFNHGHFGAYNRGVFEHAGPGVPGNFHPAATRGGFARGPVGERPAPGAFNRPAARAERPSGEFAGRTAARPQAQRSQNFERPQYSSRPAARGEAGGNRPQPHAAPQGHASPQGHAAQQHGRPEEHEHR